MRIFGRERQSLRLEKVKAARAMYMDGPGTEEIEITLLTEEGDKLVLQMRPQLAHALVTQVGVAYDSIAPRLHKGDAFAQWDGMS